MSSIGLAPASSIAGFSLLKTKLQIPVIRHSTLPRPHLTARLESDCAVTLITAPPASGKTTLLAEWTRQTGDTVAWLTLDELDNDLPRFLAYLIAALREGQAPAELTITAALNAWSESPLTLVIDNYHLISNPAIHDVLKFMIDHLPARARLIIAGRTMPPLSLARQQIAGNVIQLHDLNFTLDEAQVFLNSTAEVAQVLLERTAGWIGGLHLASLWLGRGGEAQAFNASYRLVYDYFMQEVLAPQPSALQAFLLDTGILDPLSADLCNAVTGRSDSQFTLERLEQLHLFIVPQDDLRQQYRYHPLFAEFLRECLRKQGRGSGDLHLRAADWYESVGDLAAAINHVLATNAWDRAVALIERAAGCGLDVTRWEAALPEGISIQRVALPEPLSERETEVLHLVASGMSNPEIAGRLIIAVSTVKTHVKNIYRKLDVDTRFEAMQRARELNLTQIQLQRDYRRLIK